MTTTETPAPVAVEAYRVESIDGGYRIAGPAVVTKPWSADYRAFLNDLVALMNVAYREGAKK